MTPDLYGSSGAKYEISGGYPNPIHETVPQGMRVQTLEVDNNSYTSLYLPDLGRFVPPQTAGWRGRCNGLTQLNAVFLSPTGVAQPTSTDGMSILIIAHADLLDPSPGVAYATSLLTSVSLGSVNQGTPNGGGASAWPVSIANTVATAIWVNNVADVGFAVTTVAVNNVALALPTVALALRRSITIVNNSAQPLYIGTAAVAGAANGLLVPAGGERTLLVGPAVTIYGIIPAGGPQNIEVVELA